MFVLLSCCTRVFLILDPGQELITDREDESLQMKSRMTTTTSRGMRELEQEHDHTHHVHQLHRPSLLVLHSKVINAVVSKVKNSVA